MTLESRASMWRTVRCGAVLMAAFSVMACGSAGAGDGGGGGGGGGGAVPANAAAAVDGSAYGYMEFAYYDADGTDGYLTEVYLEPPDNETPPEMFLFINDASDSGAIDEGTYTFDPTGGVGTVEEVQILGPFDDISTGTFSYAASVFTKEAFEASEFPDNFNAYDQVVSGSVTVSRARALYTISWSFTTADGDTLVGSYTGPVDFAHGP